MNVVNVFIAGFFVERVDILGNDGNFGRIFVLQAGNRQMRRIGFGFLDFEFEVVVKVVYQCRIAPETFDGGDVFDSGRGFTGASVFRIPICAVLLPLQPKDRVTAISVASLPPAFRANGKARWNVSCWPSLPKPDC